MTDYQKGSLGAADAKTFNTMLLVFAIIVALTALLFFIPFNVTSAVGYPHAYFVRASGGWKAAGIAGVVGWFIIYFLKRKEIAQDTTPTGWIWVTLIVIYVLIITSLSGWNWDLKGIE